LFFYFFVVVLLCVSVVKFAVKYEEERYAD
jgi:hypothetical protein